MPARFISFSSHSCLFHFFFQSLLTEHFPFPVLAALFMTFSCHSCLVHFLFPVTPSWSFPSSHSCLVHFLSSHSFPVHFLFHSSRPWAFPQSSYLSHVLICCLVHLFFHSFLPGSFPFPDILLVSAFSGQLCSTISIPDTPSGVISPFWGYFWLIHFLFRSFCCTRSFALWSSSRLIHSFQNNE